MKKKALALLFALVLAIGTTMTVYADSPAVGTTEQPVETQEASTTVEQSKTTDEYAKTTVTTSEFVIAKVSDTTVQSAGVATQNLVLNDLEKTGTLLGRSDITVAASDPNAVVKATILTTVDVSPKTAVKDADGYYNVTVGVDSVKEGDAIVVLHYTGSGWEVIVPGAVANGSVFFKTKNLSPISIVKISVTTAQAEVPSPQTGESVPYAIIIMMIVGCAGAAVCGNLSRKKK